MYSTKINMKEQYDKEISEANEKHQNSLKEIDDHKKKVETLTQ